MTEVIIYTDLDMILYGAIIVLLSITSLKYLGMARKKTNLDEKSIDRAYGGVFLGLMVSLGFIIPFLILVGDEYVNHAHVGDPGSISMFHLLFLMISSFTYMTFISIFIFTFEKVRGSKRKKYVGLMIFFIFIVLEFTLPVELFIIIYAIFFTVQGLYFMHSMFMLLRWVKEELKIATLFIMVGSILIADAMIFLSPLTIGMVPSITPPVFYFVGTVLCMTPSFMEPRFFLRVKKYRDVFYAVIVANQVVFLIFFIFIIKEFTISFLFLLTLVFYCIETYLVIKASSRLIKSPVQGIKAPDMRGIFTRPESLTEEEVSVSKEKKICLVCKSEVARKTYICPGCMAFYCERCADVLVSMENACWACNVPISPEKPVKQPEREDRVETEVLKK